MIYRRIHTDQTAWFCVFRSDAGEHVLYAALREAGLPEIAMRLTDGETATFRDHPADFAALARDFTSTHDSPLYSPRKVAFRSHGADLIEII
jgi:hypothetical protein